MIVGPAGPAHADNIEKTTTKRGAPGKEILPGQAEDWTGNAGANLQMNGRGVSA